MIHYEEVIRFETENICFTSLHSNPHINVFFCPSHQLNDIQSVLHYFTCKYVYNPHVNGPFCPSQLTAHFIAITPLSSDHLLSSVTIIYCSLGRSHLTGLTVPVKQWWTRGLLIRWQLVGEGEFVKIYIITLFKKNKKVNCATSISFNLLKKRKKSCATSILYNFI
jgi:hypothetical protein